MADRQKKVIATRLVQLLAHSLYSKLLQFLLGKLDNRPPNFIYKCTLRKKNSSQSPNLKQKDSFLILKITTNNVWRVVVKNIF